MCVCEYTFMYMYVSIGTNIERLLSEWKQDGWDEELMGGEIEIIGEYYPLDVQVASPSLSHSHSVSLTTLTPCRTWWCTGVLRS